MSKGHLLSLTLLSICVNALSWQEFGRGVLVERPTGTRREPIRHFNSGLNDDAQGERQNSNIGRLIMELEEILNIEDVALEFSLSLSMSILSNGVSSPASSSTFSPTPTLIPNPSVTTVPRPPNSQANPPVPTISDNVTPTANDTIAPGPATAISVAPTPWNWTSRLPSPSPSVAPARSPDFPSIGINTPAPTLLDDNSTGVPTRGLLAFDCDENGGVSLTSVDDHDVTLIFLLVGYQAESTSNSTSDYEDELEQVLLDTAVLATLGGCNGTMSDRRRRLETDEDARQARRHLVIETVPVGPCEATLNQTESCTILETELLFYVKGSVDPDAAAYTSYAAIENHMTEDKYIGIVPTILLLVYLSPLPLVPPPLNPENGTDEDGTDGSQPIIRSNTAAGRLSVSPWTIGACVATIMGGIISLLVYSRNRQARRRHRGQYDLDHPVTPVTEEISGNGIAI